MIPGWSEVRMDLAPGDLAPFLLLMGLMELKVLVLFSEGRFFNQMDEGFFYVQMVSRIYFSAI
jgi:hypothetical protein